VKNYELKLSADDILNNFDEVENDVRKMTNDKKNEALDQVVLFLSSNDICVSQVPNLKRFMDYVSDEVVVDFIQDVMKTKNKHNILIAGKAFKSRVVENVRRAGGY